MIHGERSKQAFKELCVWAAKLEQEKSGSFSQEMLAYAKENLRSWSPYTTSLSMQCHEPERVASVPWLPIIGGVTLDGFASHPVGQVVEQLTHLPPLAHLGIVGLSIRQKEFIEAIEAGLFDGLRSIEIRNCPLRTQTFEPLIQLLAEREGLADLEELRFTNCNIKAAHIELLCNSSLPGRLRVLGLGRNTSVKSAGAKALLRSITKFERLERLLLEETGLNNAAAKLLASATFPQTLVHIGLSGNEIKAAGLKALAKAKRSRMLADRSGEQLLDTSSFAFDEAAVRACAKDGMFEDITRWRMGGWHSELPSLDVVREDAEFEKLRELNFRDLYVEDQEAFVAFVESLESLDKLYFVPHEDETMIRLLKAPALRHTRELNLGFGDAHGVEALSELLDWPGLGQVKVLSARCEATKGSKEYHRALESGEFYENAVFDDKADLWSHKRYELEPEDECVYSDGRMSSKWIIKHAWKQ